MNVEWIITEPVTGEETDAGTAVRRSTGETIIMTTDSIGRLLFDGQFVDVGEDLMLFVATADEIAETGASEPYQDEEEQ